MNHLEAVLPWRNPAYVLALGFVLVAPAWAEEPARDDLPWLRRWSPELRQEMEELPPFFRDTRLNLHLRTFYLNRSNRVSNSSSNSADDADGAASKSNSTASEALATGGWIDYRSGWLLDTFAVGAVGYLSEPLYAPSDRDGTGLLEPGQKGYAVLGQAWAALRYKDYALLKGPRQLVDQGYVNPHDARMTPNTFEGVTLSGAVGPVEYFGGFLAREKPRNDDEFIWMTERAGIARHHNGLGLASVRVMLWEKLSIYAAEYYLPNGYNTAFGQVAYSQALGKDWGLSLGFQYTDQRNVGGQLLGDFVTWNTGGQAQLSYAGATLTTVFAFTGMANNIQTSFGVWPGYLALQLRYFDLANQNAWGVGLAYDFARIGLRGLTASTIYAEGTNAVKPGPSTPVANKREGDFRFDYATPDNVLRGFSFTFRAGALQSAGQRTETEFRIIMNYEISAL